MSNNLKIKTNCNVCCKTIARTHRFINCQLCESKVHIKCNKTDTNSYNKIKKEHLPEICFKCQQKSKKCGICLKVFAKNHKHIKCSKCLGKFHLKCNETDEKIYNQLKFNESILCIKCKPDNFPFQALSDIQFFAENNTIKHPTTSSTKTKCGGCTKTIAKNHRKIICQFYNTHCHIKCNNTDVKTFNKINRYELPQVCFKCYPKYKLTHDLPDPPFPSQKFQCGVCTKTIANNHRKIHCSSCNSTIHIKCNKTDVKTYDMIKEKNLSVICITCQVDNIPFQNLSDIQLAAVSKGIEVDSEALEDVSVTSTSLKSFFIEINKSNPFDDIDSRNDDNEDDDAFMINCKYVDLCNFNFKSNEKNFSIFHTNIGSLKKHKEELETILNMLDFKFDVIGITETKLAKDVKPNFDIQMKGYKCYHVDTEADKGGSLIYISKSLNPKPRPDLESLLYKSEVLESTFIEIINPKKKNVLVGCIYRHPSMDLDEFNNEFLAPFMEILDKEKKKKYLLGDINIDLLKIDDDTRSSTYFDTMSSNLFIPHIIHPTRITPTSKTLIDHIWSNSVNYQEGISGNLTVSLSDHLAQFLIIPEECHRSTLKENQNQYTYDVKNFDRENFILDMLDLQWHRDNYNDPNDALADLQDKIETTTNKYLHKRKMTKKEVELKQKPWVTTEIQKMILERNKLHRLFLKVKESSLKDKFYTKYKSLRNQVVSISRLNKKEYYKNYFLNNANNLRNTWRGIKTIINLDGKKSSPSSLLINKELITNPTEIANEFNNYFSKIASKLQTSIHYQGQDFNKYLINRAENSFFIKPTDKSEIVDTINRNINNKAVGPNSIPNTILHMIKFIIAEPLADIINLSFETGIYIDKLKISRVVPIFKEKGNNLLTENFRPISLLSNINKIFEKIMHNRLYDFLEDQGLLFKNQFGFRKKHSTTHALIDLTEDIRKAIDENKFVCGVFIDLQKAFDTVDHDILLKKLEHYGIRGIANKWFRSYLTNRKQYVSISGFNSDIANMDFGVPQGSVLGPLLFLIYINDLNHAIKYCKTRHFADDTNLLIKNESLKQLQKYLNLDLRQLCNWLKANKISLNCGKTELILFRHPNKKINYDLKIKINGKKLLQSSAVKYLGIILDPHLNWSAHVNSLAAKLSRAAGMLAKVRHFVNNNTLRNIYFGIFSSLLTYGAQVWAQFFNKHIFRIQKIQNKAIRIINFANYRDDPTSLYKNSSILKLSDHIKLENFNYVHNSLRGNLPLPLRDSFQQANDLYDCNTRGASLHKILLPKARTLYGINSITYQAAAAWNLIVSKLPKTKFDSISLAVCKKEIRKHFIDNYMTTQL